MEQIKELNRYIEYLSYIHLDPNKEKWTENFMASKSGSMLPSSNRVFISNDFDRENLAELKNFFSDLPFTILLDKNNKIGNETARKMGLKLRITYPLMEINLEKINSYSIDPAIEIKQAFSKNQISEWIFLVCSVYNIVVDEFTKFISYLLSTAHSNNIQFYIGYYNKIPCATNMLILRNNVADIHWIGTLPGYRKKGIGHAVSLFPLHKIKKLVNTAILYSSEMGKPLYEKIGFMEIGQSHVYYSP